MPPCSVAAGGESLLSPGAPTPSPSPSRCMRTPCCLLSVSALLVGALAIGNPFLPTRNPAATGPVDREVSPATALAARSQPQTDFVRAAWFDPRVGPRRSPAWALRRPALAQPAGRTESLVRPASHPVRLPVLEASSHQPQ